MENMGFIQHGLEWYEVRTMGQELVDDGAIRRVSITPYGVCESPGGVDRGEEGNDYGVSDDEGDGKDEQIERGAGERFEE